MKWVLYLQIKTLNLTAHLSTETWQAGEWHDLVNGGKSTAKNTLPRKAIVQNRRRKRGFQKKLKEFVTNEPALQEILKGTLWVGKRLERNREKSIKNGKTSNRMALNSYLAIITECKWTKCSNQKTKGVRMDKKTRPMYMLPIRGSFST